MVRRSAEHLDALHARDNICRVAVIHTSDCEQCAAADPAILIGARFAECVDLQLADGVAGLVAALDHLRPERKHVPVHKVRIAVVGPAKQRKFADAQQIDAVRHAAAERHFHRGGGAAADPFERAADRLFDVRGEADERLHIAPCRLDRAVAAQVYAHTGKVQVLQLVFDLERGFDRFFGKPEAFAQIAEIHHQNHIVDLVLFPCFFIGRAKNGDVAL